MCTHRRLRRGMDTLSIKQFETGVSEESEGAITEIGIV